MVGPQPWTGVPVVGEMFLGDVEWQWGQVGADAQGNQHRAAGPRDAEGFGGDERGRVAPFSVGGDEDDDVAGG